MILAILPGIIRQGLVADRAASSVGVKNALNYTTSPYFVTKGVVK